MTHFVLAFFAFAPMGLNLGGHRGAPLLIGGALTAGVIILVLCIAIGLFGFSPGRAQAIRDAEAAGPMVIEEVRRVHITRADRFRRGRIDRHPSYLAPVLAAFCYSICILSGADVTSNVASLSDQTRFTMSIAFLVGSTLVFAGAAMGLHFMQWDIFGGVRDNIASSRLGDDIRLPYTFACIGMVSMSASFGLYATTSFKSTTGSLGGWMTAILSATCGLMLLVFYSRIRQYSRTRSIVIEEAVANVIQRGDYAN